MLDSKRDDVASALFYAKLFKGFAAEKYYESEATRIASAAMTPAIKHGNPRAKPQAAFKFVAVGDLEIRDPEFIVDGLVEAETLGLVFGDPASGKSFLAVDLALSVATGTEFHGRATRQGSVFLSQAKDITALHGASTLGAVRAVSRCLASRCSNRNGQRSFLMRPAQRRFRILLPRW